MTGAIHFENAPLEEVVCGVQFAGIKWSDIHFGLFFTKLEGRYEQTQRRPHISLFDSPPKDLPQIQLVTEIETPLLWYETTKSPFLLQIQEDAFFLNWRRQSGTFVYPHFRTRHGGDEGVWDRFIHEWNVFRNFCEEQEIGTPEVRACHLAYIDHMVHGEAWNAPVDLVKLIRPVEGLKNLESLSVVNMTIRYKSRDLPIHINIRPAVRKNDQKKLFIMEFIITEKLSTKNDLSSWFEKSHEVIVQEFLAQTTGAAHEKWGLSHV